MMQFFIIFMILPFIFTALLYIVLKQIGFSQVKSFRLASDFTTPILLFSVPIIFKSIWGFSITYSMFVILILAGIILTYLEWRTKKEIEILILLKKIWRTVFLILAMMYIIIMFIGLITWTIHYLMN